MKKALLLAFLLFGLLGYTQKKVSVYNFSSFAMKIYNVRTKPTTGTYPYYVGYSVGLYPNESAILENNGSTTKFPFYSPVITPTVYWATSFDWTKYPAIGAPSTTSGSVLWNTTAGNTQVLKSITYSVGAIGGSSGVPLTIPNVAPYTYSYIATTWRVDYERVYLNLPSLTNYEDVIIFSDL
jgi:hypothetical protein